MTNVSFNILLFPDNVLEGNEVFSLIINQTSFQTVVIPNNSTLFIIIDDDCKYFKALVEALNFMILYKQLLC